jgi:hypothetical protein
VAVQRVPNEERLAIVSGERTETLQLLLGD